MASPSQEPIQISDDEIFRRKLLMDGEGLGDDRRLTILFRSFVNWCDTQQDSDEQIVLGYEGLLTSLDNCELQMRKSHQAQVANKRDIQNYEEQEAEMKYDALARIITQLPDRKETEIKLKLLNEEITALNDTNKQLESKIDTRHKELKVLLNSAAALEEHIKDEELQLEME